MKKLLAALFLLASSAPLSARVNVLEPWSPGVDLDVPREAWGHGANMRVGRGDADLFELAYVLSHAPRSDWEVGGTLGYVSLDRPAPVKSDTGLSDLTAAAKHRFSPSSSPGALEMAAEAGLSLPTGDPDHGIGAGGVGLLLGWGAKTPVQEVTGYAHFGVRLHTGGGDTQFGNVFSFTLGAEYPWRPGVALTADLRGFNRGKDKVNGVRTLESTQELYLVPGVIARPARSRAHFLGALLIGLSNESYDLGLSVGAKF
jgi:hypothetical protein